MLQKRVIAFRFLTLFLGAFVLLTGCIAPAAPASVTNSVTSTTAAKATLAGFPLTIENCGRTLTFTKPPSVS